MKRIPEEGVTAIPSHHRNQMPDVLTAALKNVAAVVSEGYEGAEILGVHFEGPYLDMEYKGRNRRKPLQSHGRTIQNVPGGRTRD